MAKKSEKTQDIADATCRTVEKHSATWTEAAEEVLDEIQTEAGASDCAIKDLREHAAG